MFDVRDCFGPPGDCAHSYNLADLSCVISFTLALSKRWCWPFCSTLRILQRFRAFELTSPFLVKFQYDAIFVDPPFSNITLPQLRKTIRSMASTQEQLDAPLFLVFNADREDEIMAVFKEYNLQRKYPALRYRSVKEEMQNKIFLFAPKGY